MVSTGESGVFKEIQIPCFLHLLYCNQLPRLKDYEALGQRDRTKHVYRTYIADRTKKESSEKVDLH